MESTALHHLPREYTYCLSDGVMLRFELELVAKAIGKRADDGTVFHADNWRDLIDRFLIALGPELEIGIVEGLVRSSTEIELAHLGRRVDAALRVLLSLRKRMPRPVLLIPPTFAHRFALVIGRGELLLAEVSAVNTLAFELREREPPLPG